MTRSVTKDTWLSLRVPSRSIEAIDAVRGSQSRAAWIRERISRGLAHCGADRTGLVPSRPQRRDRSSHLSYVDGCMYLVRSDPHLPRLLGRLSSDGVWESLASGYTGGRVARRYRRECAKDGIDLEKLPERLYKFLALYPEKL